MNATDIMQKPMSPASPSPSQSPMIRFRHSCEHCSNAAAQQSSPSLGLKAYKKRFPNPSIQPISIPAASSFNQLNSSYLQPGQPDMRHASAPIHAAAPLSAGYPMGPNDLQSSSQTAGLHLRPASAIPPHLSSHSSLASSFSNGMQLSPFATSFGCSLPSDFGSSTPGYSDNAGSFSSMSSLYNDSINSAAAAAAYDLWNCQGFENTPEISINGMFTPEAQSAMAGNSADAGLSSLDANPYKLVSPQDIHMQTTPLTAPAKTQSFAHDVSQTNSHTRSMSNESANSISNLPLIQQSAMESVNSTSLFGLSSQPPVSFSMPLSFSTASSAAVSSGMDATRNSNVLKSDEAAAYMEFLASYGINNPEHMPDQSTHSEQN
ncbi:hypothetical protein EV183_004316 [Coemansia sp. RSA 2336]|nr:hypothetical protein EV183_004316 [Coemansia sp. RSA 2336]